MSVFALWVKVTPVGQEGPRGPRGSFGMSMGFQGIKGGFRVSQGINGDSRRFQGVKEDTLEVKGHTLGEPGGQEET